VFRSAGCPARAERQLDAWLRTHAAFEVPLGQAVHAAGGPDALADDPAGLREMIRGMRRDLEALPTQPVPRVLTVVRTAPEGLLVALLRRFLRSPAAAALRTASPAAAAELDRLAEQLKGGARER